MAALCLVPIAVAVVLAANLCVATIGATVDLHNLSNCFKYPLSKIRHTWTRSYLVAVLPAFGLKSSRLLMPEC